MFDQLSTSLWLIFLFTGLFVLGITVGSFLNVVIARLPAGKKLTHPPSQCMHCGRRIPLTENLPLVSYWWLRGRCRGCGTTFSMRYFWVELLTGVGFIALYFLEIGWEPTSYYQFGGFWYLTWGIFPPYSWLIFAYHALLLCCLVLAAGIGVEYGWVPRRITALAVVVGLVGSACMPWPWPYNGPMGVVVSGSAVNQGAGERPLGETWADWRVWPRCGVQLWPVWGPPPEWLSPGGTLLGLTTSLAGAAVGLLLARGLLFPLESQPQGRPLGAGEADFLAAAGAVLGWQPLAVAVALTWPIVWCGSRLMRARTGHRPALLSPVLATAVAIVWLGWTWIGHFAQPVICNAYYMLAALGLGMVLLPIGLLCRPLRPLPPLPTVQSGSELPEAPTPGPVASTPEGTAPAGSVPRPTQGADENNPAPSPIESRIP